MESSRQWQQHSGLVLDRVNEFDVIECLSCGYKHVVPIPSQEELVQVYREDYYSHEKPLYLDEHQEDLDWWNLVYDERYDYLESQLPGESRSLLDIGSGPGFFLLRGKARGWKTTGVEPSKRAAAHSRDLGLDVREGFVDEAVVKSLGTFDVVYLHEVLEHIPNPASLLSIVSQLLKPGGILCVIVPNDTQNASRLEELALAIEKYSNAVLNIEFTQPGTNIDSIDGLGVTRIAEKLVQEIKERNGIQQAVAAT